jgi:hypothetical protein
MSHILFYLAAHGFHIPRVTGYSRYVCAKLDIVDLQLPANYLPHSALGMGPRVAPGSRRLLHFQDPVLLHV